MVPLLFPLLWREGRGEGRSSLSLSPGERVKGEGFVRLRKHIFLTFDGAVDFTSAAQ